jgi:cytochrome c-type biogenesis protein CcmE
MKPITPVCARRLIALAVLACLILMLTACDYLPLGYVSIKNVINDPTQYDGQKIKVKGRVSDVTKIPFLQIRFYVLNDEGYQIMVVAKETIPATNKEITVIGVVENFAIVGNESLGLHLREIKRFDHVFY